MWTLFVGDTWDFNEAKELKVWIDACIEELVLIEKNRMWELVDLLIGMKAIGLKWVFKIKRNADGRSTNTNQD